MSQSYKTGTVTVTAGSDIVVGSGTAWALALATGGLFCCMGISVPGTVIDDTHLKIDFVWPGASGSGLAYSIFRETAQAASAVLANDRLAEVVDRLNKLSYINFDAMGILAQRAAYDTAPKDFIFLDIEADPFALYIKASGTAGDWAGPNQYGQGPEGPPGADSTVPGPAYNARGAYGGATAYAKYDVVLYQGSSYVAKQATTGNLPTDTTYWQLLAQKGTDGTGTGDMTKAVFDPANKNADVFAMENMAEGTDAKVMTAAERTKLAGVATGADKTTAATVGAAAASTSADTPADSDSFISLKAGSSTLFRLTWAGLKSLLKTYFDGIYATVAQGAKADAALPRSGGTLTGALVLSGAPTNDLHAATKKYVDDQGGGGTWTSSVALTGTAIDLTGIPAGAQQVIAVVTGATGGSGNMLVQLGTSGGVDASTYSSTRAQLTTTAATVVATTGFDIAQMSASTPLRGIIHLYLADSSTNSWVLSWIAGNNPATAVLYPGSGSKSLSGVLDRIRFLKTANDYTAGSVRLFIK